MNSESSLEKLKTILATYSASIGYRSLADEIDYTKCDVLVSALRDTIIMPSTQNSVPLSWAEKCIAHFQGNDPCILIPGRQFDAQGTRHGRGHGWYDRFLAALPPQWLRIGITDIKNISSTPLLRQPWDQPMDWLLVHDGSLWHAYEPRHEANQK